MYLLTFYFMCRISKLFNSIFSHGKSDARKSVKKKVPVVAD